MERLIEEIHKSQRGLQEPMSKILWEFGRASSAAGAQFNKAYREATAWQHKRREGIGGA